jgi:hypothetical protein
MIIVLGLVIVVAAVVAGVAGFSATATRMGSLTGSRFSSSRSPQASDFITSHAPVSAATMTGHEDTR